MRLVSKILAGIIMGVIAILAASPVAAVFVESGNSNIVFAVVFGAVLLASILAPTGRRAWGRGSLLCGLLFVVLPISTLALSGQVTSDIVTNAAANDAGAAAIGATIGSGLMVGASMFIGFIFGAIFVILGLVLLLGGTRDVRIVDR